MNFRVASSRFTSVILIQLLLIDLLLIGILVHKIKSPSTVMDNRGMALAGVHTGFNVAKPGTLSFKKPVWVLKPLEEEKEDHPVVLAIPTSADLQRDLAGRISFSAGENRAMTLFNLNRYQQEFTATAYDLSFACCGKYPDDPEYGITFSGRAAQKGRTIAVDPSVIPLGSRVYIRFPAEYAGLEGWYMAEDTGSKVKGKTLDVYFGPAAYEEAMRFGRQKIKIIVLPQGDREEDKWIRKAIGSQLPVNSK